MIKHEMSVAADQSPTAATNTLIYYTSYMVGNVSLGLAHGMEGILHVVTVARDNRKGIGGLLERTRPRRIHESES
jgi:hypothetical protein